MYSKEERKKLRQTEQTILQSNYYSIFLKLTVEYMCFINLPSPDG